MKRRLVASSRFREVSVELTTAPSRALQKTTEFTYDTEGFRTLRAVTLDSGETISESWEYDQGWVSAHQIVSSADPQIFRTEYTFYRAGPNPADPPTNVKEIKRRRDNGNFETTLLTYNANGQLETITPPAVTPADGLKIVRTFYGIPHQQPGLLKDVSLEVNGSPDPHLKREFDYDAQGMVQTVTDANSNTTTYVWDDLGRLVSTTNARPTAETTSFDYGAPNATDPTNTDPGRYLVGVEVGATVPGGEGQVRRLIWNDRGFLETIERKDDAGVFQTFATFASNSDGMRTRSVDAVGQVKTFGYDVLGRITSVTDYAGLWTGSLPNALNTTTFGYDALGNRTLVEDAKGRDTVFVHDDWGRVIDVIQQGDGDAPNLPTPLSTQFEYDAASNVRKVIDPKNQETTYVYDALSRLGSVEQHLGQTVAHEYDERGRLEKITNARGQALHYFYEPWGAVERVEHDPDDASATPPTKTVSYTYDVNGNLRSTSDDTLVTDAAAAGAELPAGRLYSFAYDELNRVTQVDAHYLPSPATDPVLVSAYDRFGNRDQLTLTDGDGIADHQWDYNKLNRLFQATLPGGTTPTLALSYLANDDLDVLTHGNGLLTDFNYHDHGPLQEIEVGSVPLHRLTYTVDGVLNIDTVQETIDGALQSPSYDYDYDAAYRLTGAEYPAIAGFALPASEGFAYDAAGNRDDDAEPDGIGDGTHTYDANNQIASSPGTVYVFDADGNLESTNDGGAPATTLTTLTWDVTHRLQKFERTSSGLEASYTYDPFGRRIRKVVDPDGAGGTSATTTWYVWDGDRLVAEYDGGDRKTRYAYAGGLAPLQVAHDDGLGGEEILEVHVDHLGAPRMLTDPAGTPVWRAVYEVAGAAIVDADPDGDQSTVVFNPRVLGQYFDVETGLHYNRFRYYDPAIGRYISADPIGQLGGVNLFQYARANPTNFFDPFGLMILPPDPSGLGSEWTPDPSHKDPNGERFRGPNDETLDFHKGREGEKGWKGKDHWHYNEGDEHLKPGDEIPDPVCEPEPQPDPMTNICEENPEICAAGALGTGYLIYRGLRMLPSLAPPLWPTIPANAAIP